MNCPSDTIDGVIRCLFSPKEEELLHALSASVQTPAAEGDPLFEDDVQGDSLPAQARLRFGFFHLQLRFLLSVLDQLEQLCELAGTCRAASADVWRVAAVSCPDVAKLLCRFGLVGAFATRARQMTPADWDTMAQVPEIDRPGRQLRARLGTCLHAAVLSRSATMVDRVLRHCPSLLEVPSRKGVTPLFMAACLPETRAALALSRSLLRARASPDAWCGRRAMQLTGHTCDDHFNPSTPLIEAISRRNLGLVDLLLQARADVNNAASYMLHRRSPLLCALWDESIVFHEAPPSDTARDLQIIRLLLAARVDVDGRVPDKHGKWPGDLWRGSCFFAAARDKPQALRLLIDARADPFLRDDFHDSPLDVAKVFISISCIALLRELEGGGETGSAEESDDDGGEALTEHALSESESDPGA